MTIWWDGTGAPVSVPPAAAYDDWAIPPTLLSLPRYAKILGINPVHFQGAVSDPVWPLMNNSCNDVWARFSWQYADSVSHYDLALAIRDAEATLAELLGWWPAPTWIAQEVHPYPRHYRKDVLSPAFRDVRGRQHAIKTRYGKVISGGRRGTEEILLSAGVTYSDYDGDGFSEVATVSATVPDSVTSVNEVQIFRAGLDALPEWEIRPARRKTLVDNVFTGIYDSWLFIQPQLLGAYPTTDGFGAIDITTTANYVRAVDVYRVYSDTSQPSAEFWWEPLEGCSGDACAVTIQDGCLHSMRNPELGLVVPAPADYDDDGAWTLATYAESRPPDGVKLWYYSGEIQERWLAGTAEDSLSPELAMIIAMIATARLERPFCTCGNVAALTTKWQANAAMGSSDLQVDFGELSNPIGTHYGEILAWRAIKHRLRRIPQSGGAI